MFWKKRRVVLVFLVFLGLFNLYCLRVNMSIAIVAMTFPRAIELKNGTVVEIPEFDWDSKLQGYILSSYFYGYITTQFPGGWIADRIGGKATFGISVGGTAILTLLTPVLAKAHVNLLIITRIIEGIFSGVSFPCLHAVAARWAPPLERSRFTTVAFAGAFIGTVFTMFFSAKLAVWFGWESIFYFFGIVALIWDYLWMFYISDTPQGDRFISEEELQYLNATIPSSVNKKRIKYPLKSIMTSPPVWAINLSNFSSNWGFYTMLTQLPKFLKEALNFDMSNTGFLSGLPYLAQGFFLPVAGFLGDWFQYKGLLTTTQVRKCFNCGAFVFQMIFMLIAAHWVNPGGIVFCLVVVLSFGAFAVVGYGVNHLDIAPQYASFLMGFSNSFGTMPGIMSPILTGYVVTNGTLQEWRIVFYVTAAVYLFGSIIYGTFSSGELQPWAAEPLTNGDSLTSEQNS